MIRKIIEEKKQIWNDLSPEIFFSFSIKQCKDLSQLSCKMLYLIKVCLDNYSINLCNYFLGKIWCQSFHKQLWNMEKKRFLFRPILQSPTNSYSYLFPKSLIHFQTSLVVIFFAGSEAFLSIHCSQSTTHFLCLAL